ncbi:MAG: cbb3-type cytochrome c oxidase subunit 3 [Porticoccaceae bacterium]|nr:cbb3-type cytochrome c oxidase subunit 3 [Pseudomonadota bacterium]HLS98781.1 cbb3-type cytochrome c oxidase subunit 3 [Porticoccaceae bacterium]
MDQGTLQGIATILAMVAFLGVCWWAYSGHKKQDFEEASQLPFADDASDSGADGDGASDSINKQRGGA